MTTKIEEMLAQNGPMRRTDLPHSPNVRAGRVSSLSPNYQGSTSVYYLVEDFDKEEVVREWAKANHDILERKGRADLRHELAKGRSWGDAVKAVLDDLKGKRGPTMDGSPNENGNPSGAHAKYAHLNPEDVGL